MKNNEQVLMLALLKRALDYNAGIIRYAAMISGNPMTKMGIERVRKDFLKMDKEYSEDLKKIVEGLTHEK